MNTSLIIATLGDQVLVEQKFSMIDFLVGNGITRFRVNLSRYSDKEDFKKRCEFVKKMKEMYKSRISIMADLPFPYEKIRIYRINDYCIEVVKDETFIVTSNKEVYEGNNKSFYSNFPNIANIVSVNQRLIYADGESTFTVIDLDIVKRYVVLKANKDCCIYSGKSLSCGKVQDCRLPFEYMKDCIADMKPDSIALSFVSSPNEVNRLKNALKGFQGKVYSKIETQGGVDNIIDISKCSNIIIARGDLVLNTEYYNLLEVQKCIVSAARENGVEVIVATGILPSMVENDVPVQSDIIDVATIIDLNVDGMIINYKLVKSKNITKVLDLVNKISFDSARF